MWIAFDERAEAAKKYMDEVETIAEEKGCSKVEFWTPWEGLVNSLSIRGYKLKYHIVEKGDLMGGGGSTKIKDTASQKALANIAAKRFNLYQQYYVPLENQFMQDVFGMLDQSAFENVSGFVNALQQPQFQAARRDMERAAFSQGVDPTSGQFQARGEAMGQAQARGMGLGTAEALSGQTDRYYQGLQNIIAMGQGQAGQAISGLSDVGDIASKRAAAEAKTGLSNYLGRQQMLGSAVGTGVGIGMAGGLFGGGE